MSSSSSTRGYCTCRNPEFNMCGPNYDPFVGYPYTPTTPMMSAELYQQLLYAEKRQNTYEEKVIYYHDRANAMNQEIMRKEEEVLKRIKKLRRHPSWLRTVKNG